MIRLGADTGTAIQRIERAYYSIYESNTELQSRDSIDFFLYLFKI